MNNNETIKLIDDAKTIAEHGSIILNYRKTGVLNRDDAIKKYINFNLKHPGFSAGIEAYRVAGGNVISLEDMLDRDIVVNLNRQLMYLGGKNLLEGLING